MVSPASVSPAARKGAFKIVGIGASAGGLEAFTELVACLPAEAPVAYVLVQHLDPTHRSLLSELLGRSATLPVTEIAQNTAVEANQIYVIPPNCDLSIHKGILRLSRREKLAGGPARSIDHFLKSLAVDAGENAIGVILSGAGSDGTEGLRAIKDAGGLTFAQDEASSKYDSMPRSAIAAGCVDFVLPPRKIAAEIARVLSKPDKTPRRAAANARNRAGRVTRKHSRGAVEGLGPEAAWPKAPEDANLRRIFLLLRTQTGIDFTLYRINTIRRRLNRRMALAKLKTLESYHALLRENRTELDALYHDLLINVTNFFRNPGVFEALKKRVFPRLVKSLPAGETLRFWVAGCSTGQEAYSYAMAFLEFAEKNSINAPLQIFATDVNARVLELARTGRYGKLQLAGLSAARVNRFFTREGDNYRVQKSLRDMVIFAQQNLLSDPPFTRVDLISCRNMLIYIEPALQQKILPTFHYAMKSTAYLVLGASESIGTFTNLFNTVEKSHKIYSKKPTLNLPRPERAALAPIMRSAPPQPAVEQPVEAPAADAYREADRLLMARYAPPSVLVNVDGEILQFRGKVQAYLDLPSGRATLNVFKLARGTLGLSVQKAIKRARGDGRPVREKTLAPGAGRHELEITVLPFKRLQTPCFLVVFEKIVSPPPKAAGRVKTGRHDAARIATVRRELGETRDHLEHLQEQHETVVEELQASNEEVQSSNEELQSLNEELETSNEELESANEELTTLNEELATRNTELRESEQRLREQAQLVEMAPLLARSSKDRIIFWNRGAERMYGFTREEATGQTSHLLLRAQYPEPLEAIQATLERQGRWEGEVIHRRKDGTEMHVATQWVLHVDEKQRMRAVLEVNTDITARKLAERSLRESQELTQRILQTSPDCVLVMDLAGRILFSNDVGQQSADRGGLNISQGMHWSALWDQTFRAEAETGYRAALSGETARFQAISHSNHAEQRWWEAAIRPILDDHGHPDRLLAVCRDITERKRAEMAAFEQAKLSSLRADFAIEVARGGELNPILQQLTQMIVQHTDSVYARIWLVDPATSTLQLQATAGLHPQRDKNPSRIPVGEGRIGAIAANKRSYIVHSVTDDPALCDPEWARRENLVSFAGFPLVYDGNVVGVLATMSRRKLEAAALKELSLSADAVALLIHRKQLEDERTRLLQHAMEARNAAVAASRAKDDFLATLSHELRTPLNPVLLLASDGADNMEFPPPVRATFETIRNNVSLEAKLIDDLLDLTRISHGKLALDLSLVDVNTAVADAVRIVSSNGDQAGVKFDVQLGHGPAIVSADPVRLQQIFWNILNNATKFTPRDGTVTVRTAVKDRRVQIEISDTGIGLKPGDLQRIFEPFSQIERRQGGLGLGLAISRQLLELHHGSIQAVSDGPGKGACFRVELPLATSKPRTGSDTAAPTGRTRIPRAEKLRLLLVEDHASTRATLRSLLTRRGFDVVVAASLAEARTAIEAGPFEILISDLGLPDGHGHDLLAELRVKQPNLVGIALSGYGTEDDRARSHAAGYANHLTKPVGMDALNAAIDDVLASDHVG